MPSDEPLRIWWNKNLHGKISAGKLAAHAAHAALKAYGIEYKHPIVVLAAGKGRIEAMPVTVHDAGHTELAPGTLTTGVEDTSHLDWLSGVIHEAKAEQREADARIAESDQFYDARGDVLSSDEVSYNAARREAAAAIRAGGTDDTPKATDASDDWVDPEPWWYPVRLNRTAHKLAQTNAQYRPRTREQWEADDTRKPGTDE